MFNNHETTFDQLSERRATIARIRLAQLDPIFAIGEICRPYSADEQWLIRQLQEVEAIYDWRQEQRAEWLAEQELLCMEAANRENNPRKNFRPFGKKRQ